MNIIALILQLAIEFLRVRVKNLELQNRTYVFDILDKFDARIDKLDAQREKLRKSVNMDDQNEAEEIFNEILEEKKKMSLWQKELANAQNNDKVKL